MPVTVNEPDPIINVTVTQRPEINVQVKYNDEPKVVQVTPGVLRGPKGDSPERSVYSKRDIVAYGPDLQLDASTGTTFVIRLKSDIDQLSVINWPNDGKTQRIALYFEQDEVGGHGITSWPAGTRWSYAQLPTLSVQPLAIDCIVLDTFDGGQSIFAGLVGYGYA